MDLCPTEPLARHVVSTMALWHSGPDSPWAGEIETFALAKLASLGRAVIPALEEALPRTKNALHKRFFRTAQGRAKSAS